MSVTFRAFRRFNDPELSWAANSTFRIDQRNQPYFKGHPLAVEIVRALAARRAIKIKEVLESFEFLSRVRKRVRAPLVADLCCGHGLVGLLMAAFDRSVKQVTLLDHKRPKNSTLVEEAILEAAPWVEGRVRYLELPLSHALDHLEPGTSVFGVHACGVRTDRVMDIALALKGHLAVMPCCYAQTAKMAPNALRESLGAELATDVHRTYRLEGEGYDVSWTAVPEAITPKCRVILGRTPATIVAEDA